MGIWTNFLSCWKSGESNRKSGAAKIIKEPPPVRKVIKPVVVQRRTVQNRNYELTQRRAKVLQGNKGGGQN